MARVPVISAEKLSFSYQGTAVLSDVSLQVFENESIGLIGPNGGGKTTLLKLIMGFLNGYEGILQIYGKSPGNYATNATRISYVPQVMRYDRHFPISVEEVVLSGILSRLKWYGFFSKHDRKAAIEAIEKVGLSEHTQRPFGELSGGQAQRALIARALVSEPRLLILDEPTASVDSQAGADIYEILKDLKGKLTILMVTHDLQAAIDHFDRLFCVQRKVFPLASEEVCEHFAVGLFHSQTSLSPMVVPTGLTLTPKGIPVCRPFLKP